MAAGLSLPEENLPAFQRTMIKIVERMKQEQNLTLELNLDAQIPWADLALPLAESFKRLAPFGPGIQPPSSIQKICQLPVIPGLARRGNIFWLLWRMKTGLHTGSSTGREAACPCLKEQFDLAYTIRTSSYRGEPELQIEWVATRTIETDTIIVTPPSTMEVEDYRHLDAFAWLKATRRLINLPFGRKELAVPKNRNQPNGGIGPSSTLVILAPPAGPEELASVVASVHPCGSSFCTARWRWTLIPNSFYKPYQDWSSSPCVKKRKNISPCSGCSNSTTGNFHSERITVAGSKWIYPFLIY